MTANNQYPALIAYARAHWNAASLCLKRLREHQLSNLLTLFATTLAFLFPALLLVTLTNLKQITQQFGGGSQIQLYLQQNIDENTLFALTQKIKKHPDVFHVDIILPKQGLKEFIDQTQTAQILDELSENPLEPVLLVTPKARHFSAARIEALKNTLESLPNVTHIFLDNLWISRLQAIITLLQKLFFGLIVLLTTAIVVVIANNAQTTSSQYQQQINLLFTIGATPTYIRRPFLYTGLLIGVCASLLALLGIYWALYFINPWIHTLGQLYQMELIFSPPDWKFSAILLLIGAILGYIGSFVAISNKIWMQD